MEDPGEMALAAELQNRGQFGDGSVLSGQKLLRRLDPGLGQILQHGLPGVVSEQSSQMVLAQPHSLCRILHTDGLRQMGGKKLLRFLHVGIPGIGFLRLAYHPAKMKGCIADKLGAGKDGNRPAR